MYPFYAFSFSSVCHFLLLTLLSIFSHSHTNCNGSIDGITNWNTHQDHHWYISPFSSRFCRFYHIFFFPYPIGICFHPSLLLSRMPSSPHPLLPCLHLLVTRTPTVTAPLTVSPTGTPTRLVTGIPYSSVSFYLLFLSDPHWWEEGRKRLDGLIDTLSHPKFHLLSIQQLPIGYPPYVLFSPFYSHSYTNCYCSIDGITNRNPNQSRHWCAFSFPSALNMTLFNLGNILFMHSHQGIPIEKRRTGKKMKKVTLPAVFFF